MKSVFVFALYYRANIGAIDGEGMTFLHQDVWIRLSQKIIEFISKGMISFM